jgi:hypothetical protein
MGHAILLACLPWLGLLVASVFCAWLAVRASGGKLHLARLRALHRDQRGAVQSLSFVLVLPFFVMIMLFIIQISQIMIGTVVVHYAAFAAARSAVVWIPANLGGGLATENCIGQRMIDPDAPYTVFPCMDPDSPAFGPSDGSAIEGLTYIVAPGSAKYNKIFTAAVLGCMSICPSRDLGITPSGEGATIAGSLKTAYRAMSPSSAGIPRINARIDNKLAYAMQNTQIEVRFFHSNTEPPLINYYWWVRDDLDQGLGYQDNELAWRDPVTVTVHHAMALLPGPGRFLARREPRMAVDEVSDAIQTGSDGVYKYPLTASATLGNEGEKSVISYVHEY